MTTTPAIGHQAFARATAARLNKTTDWLWHAAMTRRNGKRCITVQAGRAHALYYVHTGPHGNLHVVVDHAPAQWAQTDAELTVTWDDHPTDVAAAIAAHIVGWDAIATLTGIRWDVYELSAPPMCRWAVAYTPGGNIIAAAMLPDYYTDGQAYDAIEDRLFAYGAGQGGGDQYADSIYGLRRETRLRADR